METSLAVNHPHLSSISRVLAVVLPEDPLGITKFGRVYAFSCRRRIAGAPRNIEDRGSSKWRAAIQLRVL
jgi:hypothetical protein